MLTKFKLCEIHTIENEKYEGLVYDLGVDCDNSYNVEGIIVHNSVCTTKLKTGFSCPQFSAVLKCAAVANKPVVADGGIEHNGDIAKALAAGADMVMAGGIFAGFDESPGNTVEFTEHGHTVKRKEYFGSASEHNKGEKKNVEGRKIFVDYRGPIADKFKEIKEDLQSSISYSGGNDLSAFNGVKWVVIH